MLCHGRLLHKIRGVRNVQDKFYWNKQMKKIRLYIVLISVSIFLLLLEIALLTLLSRAKITPTKLSTPHTFSHSISLKNLQSFTKIAEAHRIPLIVIDKALLKSFYNGSSMEDGKIISLATFSEFINSKIHFMDSIKSLGFQAVSITGPNRRLLQHGYHVSIPLHHLFIRWGHALHLLIIHEREMNYWWFGATTLNNSLKKQILKLGLNLNWELEETALDKFEIYQLHIFSIYLHVPKNIPNFIHQIETSRFIECNFTRAEMFRQVHGRDESAEALEFKSDAWRLLAKAKSLLDMLNIPFWLSSGTCLGYYRQCDIIRHSRDVDLGIWIKDYDSRLISTFSSHGLPLKHQFGRVNDSFELSFQYGDVKLDLFFFYKEKDYVWNGGTQARTGKKFKYIFPTFHLCWTEFLELKLRIPCPTEQYILANYGPLWMTPIKTWDWKKSPSNVHENGQWPEEEWPLVIRQFQISNT